jgi:FkbM family methyltransferase
MNVRSLAKILIKKPFNSFGLDIIKRDTRRFEPTEETNFLWLTSLGINTIIDVGAHTGEFALMIHEIIPQAAIYSFEPLEDAYRQLELNIKSIPQGKAFHCALGERNGEAQIYKNEFSDSSSLLKMAELHKEAFPFTARSTLETIKVRRLDEMVAGIALSDPIMIKIDTQGYEDRVVAGGEQLIARAKLLIVEVSFQKLYEGQPLFAEIYELFRRKGFRYMGNFDMGNLPQLKNPADGSVLQANAVFLKP